MTRTSSALPRIPPKILLALIAITSLAGILRFSGLDYLLPLVIEPDPHIAGQVRTIETGSPSASESHDWPKYPLIPAQLTVLTSDPVPLPAKTAPLAEHLDAAMNPILRVRKTIAWLSLLLVPAGWLLARRFMSDAWALPAAYLAGMSLLAIHFGTQARPHAAAAAFPALTVVACMRLARAPTIKNYLLVTLAGALAIGCLQSAVALGFPVLVAHLLGGRSFRHQLKLLIPCLGLFLSLYLFSPFLFESVNLTQSDDIIGFGGHEMFLFGFRGGGIPIILRAVSGWEPALGAGALLALAYTLRERLTTGLTQQTRNERRIALAYVLPYLLVIGLNPRTYERFVLPLVPFLATWSVWALYRMHSSGSKRLALSLTTLMCLIPTVAGVKLCMLRSRPTTLDLASDWLVSNAADSADPVYIFRPNTLPLFKTEESTELDEADNKLSDNWEMNWTGYQRDHLQGRQQEQAWNLRFSPMSREHKRVAQMGSDPTGYLQSLEDGKLLVLEVYEDRRVLQEFNILTEAARDSYLKVAEFKPGPRMEIPLRYQDITRPTAPSFFLQVLRAQSFGPPLEIFALDRKIQ